MASSRRSASKPVGRTPHDPLVAALRNTLSSLLATEPAPTGAGAPAANSAPAANGAVPGLVIAYSGGLDSTVLLSALCLVWPPERLFAVHVHHGLVAAADQWVAHCVEHCERLGVALTVERIDPALAPAANVEQWARQARYGLLVAHANRLAAAAILTAHHQDDQAETLMMRLGRGAGPHGLAGIRAATRRDGVLLLRPLLDLPRESLHAYALRQRLQWVTDPSNDELRFTRNHVRHRVLPVFEQAVPGARRSLARAAQLWSDAIDLLDELTEVDLAQVGHDDRVCVLDRQALRALTPARRAWVLRAWFARRGLQMPSRAQSAQWLDQMVLAEGASAIVVLQDHAFLRYRNQVFALPDATAGLAWLRQGAGREPAPLGAPRTHGHEQVWRLPGGLGRLRVGHPLRHPHGKAGDLPALDGAQWTVCGGDHTAMRVRPIAGRHARTLKNLYQEHGVPPWLRGGFPLLCRQGRPVWSAAFGPLAPADPVESAPPWLTEAQFGWQPDSPTPEWQALAMHFAWRGLL